MGTRGYIVYYFAGRYYVFYNHYDSYPTGLGLNLAREVPRTKDEYLAWLTSMRERLQELEHEVNTMLYATTLEQINDLLTDNNDRPWEDITFNDLPLDRLPGICPPLNDLWIEWIYIVDLQAERFLVSGHYGKRSYSLDAIDLTDLVDETYGEEMSDVEDVLEQEEDDPERDTSEVDKKGYGDPLAPEIDIATGWDLDLPGEDTRIHVSVVKPDTSKSLPGGLHYTLLVRKAVSRDFAPWVFNEFRIEDRMCTPFDPAFREVCYALASMAIGDNDIFGFFLQKEGQTSLQQDLGVMSNPIHGADGFCASIEYGWHAPEEPNWLCPSTEIFTIGAVLVLPWPSIWAPLTEKQALQYLMTFATKQNLEYFYAMIISIEEVALVQYCAGTLKKTRPMALFPDYISSAKAELDTDTDAFLAMTIFLECAQLDCLDRDAARSGPLLAATNMFAGPERDFPAEIWLGILNHVSPETRRECAQVSRKLRSCVHEYTHIFDGHAARVSETNFHIAEFDETRIIQHVDICYRTEPRLRSDTLLPGKYKLCSTQKATDYWMPVLRSPKSDLHAGRRSAYLPGVQYSIYQPYSNANASK